MKKMNTSPIVIKQNTRTLVSSEKSNGLGILNSSFGLYSLEAMGYLVAFFLLLQCCSYSQYSFFSVGLWDAAHNHFISQPVSLSFFQSSPNPFAFPIWKYSSFTSIPLSLRKNKQANLKPHWHSKIYLLFLTILTHFLLTTCRSINLNLPSYVREVCVDFIKYICDSLTVLMFAEFNLDH